MAVCIGRFENQFHVITVLEILVEIFLIQFQCYVMFLLKECVNAHCCFFNKEDVFGMCFSVDTL
jgi:hypothetical protein